MDRALCWLRRDLRLSDHTALAAACEAARDVALVFVFDTNILGRLDRADRRVSFIHRSLEELDERLRERGSALIVAIGDPLIEIPRLAREWNAEAVYTNRDYEPSAKARDRGVAAALSAEGRRLVTFKDHVIYEGEEIMNGSGEPFKVFTPYKRAWLARMERDRNEAALQDGGSIEERTPDLSRLARRESIAALVGEWPLTAIGFEPAWLWLPPGERAARERLRAFAGKVDTYRKHRDFPAADNTSGLSAHLRFGTISIRELVRSALRSSGEGPETWLSELIWREFYQMILDRFPHVATGSFKHEFDSIVWAGTDAAFEAWCAGRTGYPIVDAAMRHFNATGWMHNRLRMVVASFLVKDLLVDYRRGEAYFANGLLDFDLAANNGGWQWCASTGCDAQPYFRIFNPILQSRRFDPDGAFIRAHVPELSGYANSRVHWPAEADLFEQQAAGCVIGEDYPAPIVEHPVQRERALAMYGLLRTT